MMRLFSLLLSILLLCLSSFPLKADDALLQQLIPATKSQFLPVEQAFTVTTQQNQNKLVITLQPAAGYYLYKDKIRIESEKTPVVTPALPAGEQHQDEFLGATEIYRQPVSFTLTFNSIAKQASVIIHYQGCTPGLCYPPQQKTIPLQPYQPQLSQSLFSPPADNTTQTGSTLPPAGNWLALLSFFALGIGLSLTPCVYPMYPVLSAMLSHQSHSLTWHRGFTLALAYVSGMALTYTLIGVLIAFAGAGIQGWLQNPWLLGLFSLFYLCLALSMLLGHGIRLPQRWQDSLHYLANRQSLHSISSVTILGALSGLIGSPCTSAPLSGLLLYIAQSGDPVYGAVSLLLLSFGMGLPLLLMGLFGGKILPKAGSWMVLIKQVFAILLLAMPLFLLERLLPVHIATLLWFCFATGVILWLIWSLWPANRWLKVKPVAFALVIAGSGMLAVQYEWRPAESLPFITINNHTELQQQLATAKAQGKPVMLDLYADWCTACRELDAKTFSSPLIRERLSDYQLLRADVSANSPEDRALLQELQVLGLPNVLFFDAQSQPNPQLRIQGFVSANELQDKLEQCQQNQHC